jgi:DNA-binding CsgD family transcriptional regulator
MFTLPLFMHRLVSVPHARSRNIIIGGITLFTYLGLHFLAYVVREPSQELEMFGEYLRNGIFLSIMMYSTLTGIKHHKSVRDPARRRLSRNFLILIGIFLPGIFHDTVLWKLSAIRFYPLLYCFLSILFIRYFFRQYKVSTSGTAEPLTETILSKTLSTNLQVDENTSSPQEIPVNPMPENDFFAQYDISPREKEVITLILQGYSYQKIGESLFISLNTVKTHIRNIYPKFGVKSRYELMTLLTHFQKQQTDWEE